jgi:3-hydroxybutyryl-CoA dehydrogenase
VVCGDAPGYIVPRLQALIMNEAARMIEEGVATAEEIDKATRYGLGLRFAALGVVEFIDFGGADILHHASREMSVSIDAARYRAPAILERLIADGRLGLKTGSGFYDHQGRDIPAYRRDVLARTLGMLKHAGLWRPASGDTID